MGWNAVVMPLAQYADDPAWLAGNVADPLPATFPAALPDPSAAQVLTLLRAARLSAETAPRVSADLEGTAERWLRGT